MDKRDIEFLLSQNIQIDTNNFFLNLFLAIVLSFLIQITYNKTAQTLSSVKNFSNSFIILGLTTTIIITIVKSSLALSLGLVGALSIVRFRAAIKEPEELVYLFLIIATGLGCGSGQLKITLLGIGISILIIIIYSFFFRKTKLQGDSLINSTIVFNKRISDKEIDKFIKNIKRFCTEIKFISLSSTEDETTINLDIKPKSFENLSKIHEEIKKKYDKARVLFAKNNELSL